MPDQPISPTDRRRALDAMKPDLASCATEGDIASMLNRLRRADVAALIAENLDIEHRYSGFVDGQHVNSKSLSAAQQWRERMVKIGALKSARPDYPEDEDVRLASDPAPEHVSRKDAKTQSVRELPGTQSFPDFMMVHEGMRKAFYRVSADPGHVITKEEVEAVAKDVSDRLIPQGYAVNMFVLGSMNDGASLFEVRGCPCYPSRKLGICLVAVHLWHSRWELADEKAAASANSAKSAAAPVVPAG